MKGYIVSKLFFGYGSCVFGYFYLSYLDVVLFLVIVLFEVLYILVVFLGIESCC